MIRPVFFLGAGSERERATRVGIARITVGSTMLVPPVARRLFRIPEKYDNGALRLTGRLFGIRNVVLGAWALQVRDQDPAARRACYRLNAVVDAADVLVLLWAGMLDREMRTAAVLGTALGGSALLAWVQLLQEAA